MSAGFTQVKGDVQNLLGESLSPMGQRMQALEEQQTQLETTISAEFTQIKTDAKERTSNHQMI